MRLKEITVENGEHRYEAYLLREKKLSRGILKDIAQLKLRTVPSTQLVDLAYDIDGVNSVENMNTSMHIPMPGASLVQDLASNVDVQDMFEKNRCIRDNDSVSSN